MKKDQLLPRERIMEALALREPDKVPWIELEVDQIIVDKILGKPHTPVNKPIGYYNRDVEEEKAFCRKVGKDSLLFSMRPPIFCDYIVQEDGRFFCGKGHIQSRSDFKKMIFPDLEDKAFFRNVEEYVKKKDEFAVMVSTRLGFAATYLSIGMAEFFDLLYEDMEFVLEVMDRYTKWLTRAMEIISEIGVDLVIASDDMAFKTGPMISPNMIEDFFLASMKKVAGAISLPWITHSDGNMLPMMEKWLQLEQNGIHPIEPTAMDIRELKKQFGSRICLIGNVDVDTLACGTPAQVDKIVRDLIQDIAPSGGYVFSSGNSIPCYARVENVWAMSHALEKYGNYPIGVIDI